MSSTTEGKATLAIKILNHTSFKNLGGFAAMALYSIADDLVDLKNTHQEVQGSMTSTQGQISYNLDKVGEAALELQALTTEFMGLVQSMRKLNHRRLFCELAGEDNVNARGLLNSIYTRFIQGGHNWQALESAMDAVKVFKVRKTDESGHYYYPDFTKLRQHTANLCACWEEIADVIIAIAPDGQIPFFLYPWQQITFLWGDEVAKPILKGATPNDRIFACVREQGLQALLEETSESMVWYDKGEGDEEE